MGVTFAGEMRSIHQFELDLSGSSHASLIRTGLPNTSTDLAVRHSKSRIESTQRRTTLQRPRPASNIGTRIPYARPNEDMLHPNTNEWTDASTGDVYLRARWYAPGQGRFLTKDTVEGDVNAPMSFNLWNYVQSNPIIYQDPTGNDRFGPPRRTPCTIGFGGGWFSWDIKLRVDEAERYAPRTSNEIDTYVAAGIAIQCAGIDAIRDSTSSVGIAQISYPEAETELKEDEEGNVISFGLRKRCKNGELEKVLDPMKPKDAVELMKRRILLTIEHCDNCTDTDKYIAAGLAQNGSGFRYDRMRKDVKDIVDYRRKFYYHPDKVYKDWMLLFQEDARDNRVIDTKIQLIRFNWVIKVLQNRGWFVPLLDTDDINKLTAGNYEVAK